MLTAAKQIETEWNIDRVDEVATDRTMLTVVLTNLLKNAAEYVPEQGSLWCRVVPASDGCIFTLSNSDGSLASEDLEHLVEPLWRKDKARTGSVHSGLGLSVVSQFCRLLGIDFTVGLPETGLFRVTLAIPSAVPAHAIN